MKWFVEHYASKIPKQNIHVLDVGSYDINGSYKDLFSEDKYRYTGLDMEQGPNVDVVLRNPYDWDAIETDSFDVVISGQAFEHMEFFWVVISEMTRVLKKDGLLCIIAPQGCEEHRCPVDCYRFFTDGMIAIARFVCLDLLHAHTNCGPVGKDKKWYHDHNSDSMMIAKKPYSGPAKHPDQKTYKCVPENQEKFRGNLIPFIRPKGIMGLWQKLTKA